jgi:hypothetical protein
MVSGDSEKKARHARRVPGFPIVLSLSLSLIGVPVILFQPFDLAVKVALEETILHDAKRLEFAFGVAPGQRGGHLTTVL